jgi:hypothetical protein
MAKKKKGGKPKQKGSQMIPVVQGKGLSRKGKRGK